MSTQKDFERIWNSVEVIVHGALLTESGDNFLGAANEAWQREKSKWRKSDGVQYNFLLTLRKKNPACAEQFLAAVEKFSFRKISLHTSPSSAPYIFGTFCIGAAGACAGYFLPEYSFLPSLIGHMQTIVLGGAVFAWIGGGIFIGLRKNKLNALRKKSADTYLEQLKILRKTLFDLCKKADSF